MHPSLKGVIFFKLGISFVGIQTAIRIGENRWKFVWCDQINGYTTLCLLNWIVFLLPLPSIVFKDNVDIAWGKSTWQISVWSTRVSSRAVDGNMYTNACTRRSFPHPWWAVDIGQPANVKMVNVTNDMNPLDGKCNHYINILFYLYLQYSIVNRLRLLLTVS